MEIKFSYKQIVLITIILSFISIFVLSSYIWYRPLPDKEVVIQSDFDAREAYQFVDMITKDYQYRIFGSKEVEDLGQHISDYFLMLDFKVINQRFTSWRPAINKFYLKFDLVDNDVSLFNDTYNSIIESVDGNNVMGISYGTSMDTILIGAHRDIASGIEGAEDNASGTGLMMQLAKEVSEKNHYYTYMFVSFDGEEAQEKGSDYFVKNFKDIDLIKMAIILDQVGYKEADSLMLYETNGAFNQISLESQALLKACLDLTGDANLSFDKNYIPQNSIYSLLNHLYKMSFVSSNTDCNPFYQKGIDAFGIKAINSETKTQAITHSYDDVIDNIHVDTLRMSGNFIKTLIATLEVDKSLINNWTGQYDYIISGDRYLPKDNVILCKIILFTLLLGLMIYAIRYIIVNREANTIVNLSRMIILSFLFATIQSLLIRFGLKTVFKNTPIFWITLIWILLLNLEIRFLKNIFYKTNMSYKISFANQHIINIMVFVVLSLVSSYEYATIVTFNALVFTLIYKSIVYKYKKIRFLIQGFYIVIHFCIALGAFNVFIRGVNIRHFTILQTANLFIFFSMKINVFLSNKISTNKIRGVSNVSLHEKKF